MTHSDEELVERAKAGDSDAFTALYKRHLSKVRLVATRMLRDYPGDVDDLVQKTFTNAFRYLQGFAGDAKFSTWIHSIAVREGLMFLRGNKNRTYGAGNSVPLECEDEDGEARAWDIGAEDRSFAAAEAKADVARIMPRLPAGYRRMVEARYLDDMDLEEIADRFGCSVGNVKSQLFRGKERAREIMGEMREEMERLVADKKRCVPCEKDGRFRFADVNHEGTPMCQWCFKEASPNPIRAKEVLNQPQSGVRARKRLEWTEILEKARTLPEGEALVVPIPEGVPSGKFQSNLCARLWQDRNTNVYRWSTSKSEQPGFIVARRAGNRFDGEKRARTPSAPMVRRKPAPQFPAAPKPVIEATPVKVEPADQEMVTIRVPVSVLDKIWLSRTPEQKARAAELLMSSM